MRTGFYKPLSGPKTAEVDKAALAGFSLVYIPFTLPQTAVVDPAKLLDLDLTLARCAELGVEAIVRFAYGWTSTPNDPVKSIILGHIDQVAPTVGKHAATILTLQAGFIGSWGEQNNSANGNTLPANRREINQRLYERMLSWEIVTSFRTPTIIRELLAGYPESMPLLGFHNDCLLSSETNSGTYDRTIGVEVEKAYVAKLAIKGGETCRPSAYSDGANALAEIKKLGLCYLNTDYHQDVIASWKVSGHYNAICLALMANRPKGWHSRRIEELENAVAEARYDIEETAKFIKQAAEDLASV